ncbi:chitin synthesis regulation, resistance to congo red domain-containing protein [Hirsutella rhossiliensis]|uniref:Chitin synthesis regulation, resistance to congo red domain-containing protein n=1 Tax=Hirsutella rhossiliensis TaxID=111463 RepID=A0A9P8MWV4_9HYPO|nr:chitin synthesis regulation, resistance to congo red domain-containing protein [Hirsutella rhossiliensis]KAH0962497.1 chitin synthesis regulation, resistance to congo red domain-containing protein [Hirsutella rhossiliensis]
MGLAARADDDVPFGWVREGNFIVPWWHSRTGIIVKWVIFLVLFALIMGYIVGGYLHARARLRKGLPPLAYHRCLVGRRARQPAQYQNGWPQANYGYYQPNAYPMNDMNAPPVYDPNRPPVYMAPPPDGGSKVDPSQWRNEPTARAPEANPAPDYHR